jgi:hypothetical protein
VTKSDRMLGPSLVWVWVLLAGGSLFVLGEQARTKASPGHAAPPGAASAAETAASADREGRSQPLRSISPRRASAGEAGGSQESQQDGAPRIEFDELTFNFGTMYQQEEVSHAFAFRNTGNATLKIEKVRSSCGCTAAMPDKRELAPGEAATLKVTFRSGSMRDRVVKRVYVDSNDPAQARVNLTVTGEIKVEVEVNPRGVYLGRLKIGETLERSVEIVPVDAEDFKILGVSADHPDVRVGKPVPLGKDRPGYRLSVRFGPVEEAGRISAKVTVRTNLEHTKELTISVYGRVGEKEDSGQSKAGK